MTIPTIDDVVSGLRDDAARALPPGRGAQPGGRAIAKPGPAKPAAPATAPATRALTDPVNQYGFPDQSDKGVPMNTRENLEYVLECYGITARYNVIRKKIEVLIPGHATSVDNKQKATLAEITSICARNRMPKTDIDQYLVAIADRNQHNPVKTWIESKPWDGVSRFDALAATIELAEGYPAAMRDALLRRWLISAVAAAFMPEGFEAHGALVFTGPQGAGKTRWFKRLAPAESNLVLTGAMLDPANKDTIITAVSHWIVELGEVDATFKKADIARLKAFITQSTDKFRRPYEREDDERDRRTVFCASVNDANYLVDDSGNRRWWTVAVDRIDYQHTIDMQQLWAEVLTWFKAGEQWHLTADENARLKAINDGHEQSDPIAELILAAFDPSAPEVKHMQASEVLRAIGYSQPTSVQASKAGKALAKLGFRKSKNEGRQGFWMPRSRNERWQPDDDGRPF